VAQRFTAAISSRKKIAPKGRNENWHGSAGGEIKTHSESRGDATIPQRTLYPGVIPKSRAFTSGTRDLPYLISKTGSPRTPALLPRLPDRSPGDTEKCYHAAFKVLSLAIEKYASADNYVMINECEIRNFRCFEKVNIPGLKRFTFLVGASGSGKTAFLEALFLTGGSNAEIYFRVRKIRGLGEAAIELSGTRDSFEGLFRDMFHNFDQHTGVDITIHDSERGYRTLEVFYERKERYNLPLSGGGKPGNMFMTVPITFKWTNPEKVMYSTVEIRDGQLKLEGSPDVYPLIYMSPRGGVGSKFDAQRFSELSKQNKSAPALKAVQRIFPEVRDITLENLAGELVLHAYIEGLTEKIPLVDLSSGVNKYFSIILSVLINKDGTVLIDEIENGFYYANLSVILDGIFDLCDEHKVQLIVSTHSYEFLQALAQAMELRSPEGKGFACLRFERTSENRSIALQPTVTLIEGQAMKSAIKNNFEVR